jgi:hypothetical protein
MTIATGNISERARTNNLFHVTICRRNGWVRKGGRPFGVVVPILLVLGVGVVVDLFATTRSRTTTTTRTRKIS